MLAVGNDTNDEEMFTTLNDLLTQVRVEGAAKQTGPVTSDGRPPSLFGFAAGVGMLCRV